MVCLNGVTASAAEDVGGWFDLLEETAVSSNGDNLVKISGTQGTFSLELTPRRRIAKIDMLVSYGNGSLPSYIGVDYAGQYTQLHVVDLGKNVFRAYGDLTYAFYNELKILFQKGSSGDAYYDLLSVRLCTLQRIDNPASGTLKRSFTDSSPLALPNNFSVSASAGSGYKYCLIPVTITDWRKFDSVTIFGSISKMALNSFRASIGTKGLPYVISYMESIPTGTTDSGEFSYDYNSHTEITYLGDYDPEIHDETAFEDGAGYGSTETYGTISYGGSVLFTVTIDLSGIDRNTSGDLSCFFTCIADVSLGYEFNVQYASGSIITADTSTVSWWVKFTSFMEGLFASDSDETNNMMESVADQSQDLAEDRLGAVAQAGAVIDDLTGAFQYHGVMDTIAFPALTINFGGVPWTFGGWDVSVIPAGFEPLVEMLKLLIDIVATLAFIQAMRHRLEKLLVGGNA